MGHRRRFAALLLLVTLVGLLAGGPISTVAGATGLPTNEESPIAVLVTTLAPRALGAANSPVQVAGTLTNRGTAPIRLVAVRLRVGEAITNRSQLAAADREPPVTSRRGPTVPVADLAPGASATFDLRMLVSDLHLADLGVYPLLVEARGQVGRESTTTQVGQVSTYLPWFPSRPMRTRLTWLWPVVDAPHQGPQAAFVNDALAPALGPGGRLARLLDGVRQGAAGGCDPAAASVPGSQALPTEPHAEPCAPQAVPVTYAVDADLLSDVQTIQKPYTVSAGSPTNQPGSAAATTWLSGLRAEVTRAHNAAFALPWGDPDVVAVNRDPALRDEVAKAQSLGQRTAQEILGTPLLTRVAWPPAGPMTPAALESVVGGDTTAVVLDETALPPLPDQTGRTPDTRAQLSSALGGVTGLVVDNALSTLLSAPAGNAGVRLAEQRWLVESAMIAAERPGESRTLLVAPDRRANLDPAVVASIVADTGRVPWLCPAILSEVAEGREACIGQEPTEAPRVREDRGQLEPPQSSQGEIPATALRQVAMVRAAAAQFTDDVLAPGSPQTTETKARLLRARWRTESVAWRSDPEGGQTLLRAYSQEVDRLRSMVTVTTGGRVLLTSTSGTIKVSIQNRLSQPVTVGVDLAASNTTRLSAEPTAPVEVGPSSSRTVDIKVTALTSGRFLAQAQLRDREGRPFGGETALAVHSTHYGRVALVLTGLSAGVLLLAVGVRLVRRARRPDPDPDPDPDPAPDPDRAAPAAPTLDAPTLDAPG